MKYADFNRILDKYRKIGIGMRHLVKEHAVTDWFVLDADDLVHRDFVRTLEGLPRQAGWVFRSGYLWYKDLERWTVSNQLTNICGSTTVINASLFDVAKTDDDRELRKIPWCRVNHSEMDAFLTSQLDSIDPIFPLAAVAYTLSHGDNCSDEFRSSPVHKLKLWIKKRLLTRPLDPGFASQFGIKLENHE